MDTSQALEDLPEKLRDLSNRVPDIVTAHKVLATLRFPGMRMRQDNVTENHEKTFHWVYNDAQDQSCPQVHFREWLCRNDIYWITGKAGSGKSTLLKYSYDDPRTKDFLKQWARQDRLFTPSFFFWNAGSTMQKSQQGLLQSLSYEILGGCRE